MLLSYLLDILLNHQPVRQHHYTCSKGQQLPLLVHLEPFVFLCFSSLFCLELFQSWPSLNQYTCFT